MKFNKWLAIFLLCATVSIIGQSCKVFKKNDCGCPTMNKKRMH